MARDGLTPAIRARMVQRFNARHRAGDWLRVWPGPMGEGPGVLVQVRDPGACLLGGHTPVVYVTGGHGCINLLHVRRARKQANQIYSDEEIALVVRLAAEGLHCGAIARRLNQQDLTRKRSAIGVSGRLNAALARTAAAAQHAGSVAGSA